MDNFFDYYELKDVRLPFVEMDICLLRRKETLSFMKN